MLQSLSARNISSQKHYISHPLSLHPRVESHDCSTIRCHSKRCFSQTFGDHSTALRPCSFRGILTIRGVSRFGKGGLHESQQRRFAGVGNSFNATSGRFSHLRLLRSRYIPELLPVCRWLNKSGRRKRIHRVSWMLCRRSHVPLSSDGAEAASGF